MTILGPLPDLFAHEAWADDLMLRSVRHHPATRDDPRIHERLHHQHAVQRAFLSILTGTAPDLEELQQPFDSLEQLHASLRAYQTEIRGLVSRVDEVSGAASVAVPWFPDAVLSTVQVLMQVVMHSQHHRGQNAARLRELGIEPPLFDFIYWLSVGKPEPPSALSVA